jgi:hypothetical protein
MDNIDNFERSSLYTIIKIWHMLFSNDLYIYVLVSRKYNWNIYLSSTIFMCNIIELLFINMQMYINI